MFVTGFQSLGSMGNRKKKYEAGEASNFMTRKRALKKLQLTLKARTENPGTLHIPNRTIF